MTWRYERRLRAVGGRSRTVGALERRDPIPPGFYWLVVIGDTAQNDVSKPDNFLFWVQANSTRVRVLKTVHHDQQPIPGSFDVAPPNDWFLFQVLSSVNRWGNDTGLGLPDIAPEGANSTEESTVGVPEPTDIFDEFNNINVKVPFWAWALGLTVVGAIVYGVAK